MANSRLPNRDNKKKITICPYFITERLSPYYSTTEEDSGRKQTKRCVLQTSRLGSNSPRPKSQMIANKKQRVVSASEKVEKKMPGERKPQYCESPSKKIPVGTKTGIGNNEKKHSKTKLNNNKPSAKTVLVPDEIKWDSSIENMNGNVSGTLQEKFEQRFRNVTKKLQTPGIRKIRTDMCYDESCLSKTTRKLLDNRSSTNEMLWVNPKYLDKANSLIKIPNEMEDKASRVEVPIAAFIRGQKQLKLRRNRRHGEKYFFDNELNYRRIVHDKSYSLNLHNHPSGYDDDMGDPQSMQKEMTAEEKKALGSYPDPPYPNVFIKESDFPRVIASDLTAGSRTAKEEPVSNNSDTPKNNASHSDHLLYKLGIYSRSELSNQSIPRKSIDEYLEEKEESDTSMGTYTCTNNEENGSARSQDSSFSQVEDPIDPIKYLLDKEYSSSQATMDNYLEFRSIMGFSREDVNEDTIQELSSENTSTDSEGGDGDVTSAEEIEESTSEILKKYEPMSESAQNVYIPSVFLPDMIPDPTFTLKLLNGESEPTKIETYMDSENNITSEINLKSIKVENVIFLDYKCPKMEEFYTELDKWRKLVNRDIFRRHLRGPGLKKYANFAVGQTSCDKPQDSPKSEATIFEEMYRKYTLSQSTSTSEIDSENFVAQEIVVSSNSLENKFYCPSAKDESHENICIDCIYKSPENHYRFPLQIIAEEESECEVDFGQPVITKNWLYNFLLPPSTIEVESTGSCDPENENHHTVLDRNDSEDQENIPGSSKGSPRFISDSPPNKGNNGVETEGEYWLEPTIDWENMPPLMVYNIMKLTGGFLTDVYSHGSHENYNCHQNKTTEGFTSIFTSPNHRVQQRSSIISIEEVNSAEEEDATPSSSNVTVIEKKIPIPEQLPERENIQITSTSAKENIAENVAMEKDEHKVELEHDIKVSQVGRRKLPIRIAFGLYSKLRSMRASLSRMMSGMKNYFRVKGVIRKISPSSFSQANGQMKKIRISVIKRPPSTFQTFSAVKLHQLNTATGVKTNSSL